WPGRGEGGSPLGPVTLGDGRRPVLPGARGGQRVGRRVGAVAPLAVAGPVRRLHRAEQLAALGERLHVVCGPAHGVPVVEAPVDQLPADVAGVGLLAELGGFGSVGAVVSASLLGHDHLPTYGRAPAVPGPSDSTSQSITMVR